MARDGWYDQQMRVHGSVFRKRRGKSKHKKRYSVTAENLGQAVGEILSIYSAEVTENTKEAVTEVAEDTVKLLHDTSPRENPSFPRVYKTVMGTKYYEGWTKEQMFENALERRIAIYNATDYQLIHLLEWGHQRRGLHFKSGFVPAKPHVMPAYEKAQEELTKAVKEAIENANNDT